MSSGATYQQGDGCCGCNCTHGELGCGGCCFVTLCPCFAFCNAAKDAGLKHGTLYCIATCLGCGCCSLMVLGQDVEEKRRLKTHGGCWHCMHSFFNGCSCHACRVVNECKVLEEQGAVGAIEMVRN